MGKTQRLVKGAGTYNRRVELNRLASRVNMVEFMQTQAW